MGLILSKRLMKKAATILISSLMILGLGLFIQNTKMEAALDIGNLTDIKVQVSKTDVKTAGISIPSGGVYGDLSFPQDIEFDADGNMYIVNYSSATINKITPKGSVTVISSGGIYGTLMWPSDIAFDSQGNTYIMNNDRINKIDSVGNISYIANGGIFGTIKDAYFLTIDSSDNIYFGSYSNETITKVAASGAVTVIGNNGIYGQIAGPYDLEVSSDGTIFIANIRSNTISIVDPNGAIDSMNLGSYNPIDIALDGKDNLYLSLENDSSEYYEPLILKITPLGEQYLIYDFGVYGEFYGVESITFNSNDTMFFTNSSNNTINKVEDKSGVYNIRSKNSNLKMDVFNGGTLAGNNVIQWPDTGGTNQKWRFELLDSGYYKITSMLSGMSLDVYNGGIDKGNRLIQWPYHGGDNQQWVLIENGDGTISFMSKLTEYSGDRFLLDVYGGGTTAGVNVIQWSGHFGDNQKWYMDEVEKLEFPELSKDYTGTYNIRSLNSDLVMDVFNGGSDQGVNVIQWPFHGRTNQQWNFEKLDNGYYKVTSVLSGLSLDVYNRGTTKGNRVIQWPYHGGTNQQWRIIEHDDGTVSLMSRLAEESYSYFVLDVFNGGKDSGVNVIQWSAHYGANQKWKLESIYR